MAPEDPQLPFDPLSQAYYRGPDRVKGGAPGEESPGTVLSWLLRCIVLSLLLLGAVDLLLRQFLPRETLLPYTDAWAAGYTLKVRRYLEQPPPDVLFLGSSRIRLGVDSAVFSRLLEAYWKKPARVYNLGLDGAMAEEIRTLADSYLKAPMPSYVVLGVSGPSMTRVHSFQYAARYLWKVPDCLRFLSETEPSQVRIENLDYFIESMLGRLWYLFENRDALRRLITETLFPSDCPDEAESLREQGAKKAHILAADGYEPMPRKYTLEDRLRYAPETARPTQRFLESDPAVFDEAAVRMVERIVEDLESAGSKVVLVESPSSPYLEGLNPLLNGRGFRRWMAGLAERLHVPFIAFPSSETGLTDEYYGDYSHLNPAGAQRFSRLLFERLRDAGFLDREKGP